MQLSIRNFKYFSLVTIVLFTLYGCGNSSQDKDKALARPVEIIRIADTNNNALREFAGQVERSQLMPLSAEVSGKVMRIYVQNGEFVHKGKVLAQIDPEAYALAVQRARAQYIQLSQDLVRKQVLKSEGILPDTTYEQLQAATEAARVAKQLAERDLRLSQIRAPFSGRVANRLVEAEQFVGVGTPLFQFENTQLPQISIDIPQEALANLNLNASLQAQAWLPDNPQARFILRYLEHSTINSGGNTAFRVTFSTAPNQTLYAGMALRVSLATQTDNTNTFRLPITTLNRDKHKQAFVWRVDPKSNQVSKVPVNIKHLDKQDMLVNANLQSSDLLVAAGSAFLRDKQTVRAIRELP